MVQNGPSSTNSVLRAKCGFNVNSPWKREAAFAEQIICLRRDLDKLRKHTERIQTYLDIIQEVCSRRLPPALRADPTEILCAAAQTCAE